jgi:DNA-binding NarL/FixJ family response regulator
MWFDAIVAVLGGIDEEVKSWLATRDTQPLTVIRGSRRLTLRISQHQSTATLVLCEVSTATPPAGITARESDVLWLVTNGRTSHQAAQALRISTRTVEKHLENIYRKLGVTSRTEASVRVFGAS